MPFIAVMLVATLGGVFVFSALVGVIATGLDNKISELRKGRSRVLEHDHTILLGWSEQVFIMVNELVEANESEKRAAVVILADRDKVEMEDEIRERIADTKTTKVVFAEADITDRVFLERVDFSMYQNVIVLTYDHLELQEADSQTLVTLLHLRDMAERRQEKYSVVTEMRDDTNRELAQITQTDDFIVSGKLISLLMTQISENRHLATVFSQLLDASGSEIYLKPARDYVRPGARIDFHTVVESARRQGQVAIGYRVQARASEEDFGIVLNPDKRRRVKFAPDDRVIVLAED